MIQPINDRQGSMIMHTLDQPLGKVSPDRSLPDDHDEEKKKGCQPSALANLQSYHPICNDIHAQTWDWRVIGGRNNGEATMVYVDSGSFHDVWAASLTSTSTTGKTKTFLAMKRLRWLSPKLTTTLSEGRLLFDTQKEARLLDHYLGDPFIMDVYAACGTTLWTPLAHHSLVDEILPTSGRTTRQALKHYQQRHADHPWLNKLTGKQKLEIALETATSLAILHRDGVVHGDVNPSQWLRVAVDMDAESLPRQTSSGKERGRLVLNDLNAAEMLPWDPQRGTLCATRHAYRGISPEEARSLPMTTAADIYALGHIWYTVITGLQPYFDHELDNDDSATDDDFLTQQAAAGQTPRIPSVWMELDGDEHAVEIVLLRILPRCWAFNPSDRPNAEILVRELQGIRSKFA